MERASQAVEAYRARLDPLLREHAKAGRQAGRAFWCMVVLASMSMAGGVLAIRDAMPASHLLLPLGLLLSILVLWSRRRAQLYRLSRLLEFYEQALDRATGKMSQSGRTGEAYREPGHLFERDLDILGPESIFGLLANTRTEAGQRWVARYLLHRPATGEARTRQEAVKELASELHLRERIALLGPTGLQQIVSDRLEAWAAQPAVSLPGGLRWLLGGTTALLLALLAAGGLRLLSFGDLALNLLAVAAIQGAMALRFRGRVLDVLEGARHLSGQAALLRDGLGVMRSGETRSAKLSALRSRVDAGSRAMEELRDLDRMLSVLDQRTKEMFYLFALLLCVGTQSAVSLEQWRQRHGREMLIWLASWGEFDALNAIAAYAFEHPENTYPELLEPDDAAFAARGLRHPMLPSGVANDVELRAGTRFYLISGSNMAGKSTLLRAIGTNIALAYTGAPIAAAQARMPMLTLGTAISLTDSLAEGRSKFLAEVARLQEILHAAREERPLLFLIDEIFSGTNSADRRAAAEAVLQSLMEAGAIGALSTHDLALTTLAGEGSRLPGVNLHMASPDPGEPLAFDFRLKPGVNTVSSAPALLRLLGLLQ